MDRFACDIAQAPKHSTTWSRTDMIAQNRLWSHSDHDDCLDGVEEDFDKDTYFNAIVPNLVGSAQAHLSASATIQDFRDAPWMETFLQYHHAFNGHGAECEVAKPTATIHQDHTLLQTQSTTTDNQHSKPRSHLARSDTGVPLLELIARADLHGFELDDDTEFESASDKSDMSGSPSDDTITEQSIHKQHLTQPHCESTGSDTVSIDSGSTEDTITSSPHKHRLPRSPATTSLANLIASTNSESLPVCSEQKDDSSSNSLSVLFTFVETPSTHNAVYSFARNSCYDPLFPGHAPCASHDVRDEGYVVGEGTRVLMGMVLARLRGRSEGGWKEWRNRSRQTGGRMKGSALRWEYLCEEREVDDREKVSQLSAEVKSENDDNSDACNGIAEEEARLDEHNGICTSHDANESVPAILGVPIVKPYHTRLHTRSFSTNDMLDIHRALIRTKGESQDEAQCCTLIEALDLSAAQRRRDSGVSPCKVLAGGDKARASLPLRLEPGCSAHALQDLGEYDQPDAEYGVLRTSRKTRWAGKVKSGLSKVVGCVRKTMGLLRPRVG